MDNNLINLVESGEGEKRCFKMNSLKVDALVNCCGDILLNRPVFGVLPSEKIIKFLLNQEKRLSVFCNCIDGLEEFIFGIVENYEPAQNWVSQVNALYKNPPEPKKSPPHYCDFRDF